MEKYWNLALTFEEYMQNAEQRTEHAETADDKEKHEYLELGLHRMQRVLKTYKPDPEQESELQKKNFAGKILIISEPWCGDASATVPVLSEFFGKAGVSVRIFLRDSDPELINQFLTNGTQSIPKVLILNQDFSVKNSWGPRTEYGTQLLKKFKENPETYTREEFYNDLQVYYAKNRGHDAIHEILNLL